ncbi:MAG: VanZ family protein [Bacteroidia bacterium]|nr:VanZ family protein [Bacteroidia bacterium]
MNIFTSDKEKKLWRRVFLVLAAIYLSLGFAGSLVNWLEDKGLLTTGFILAFGLVSAAVLGSVIKRKLGGVEIWLLLGIIGVYTFLIVRLGISPIERTHLFEYGLLAILIKEALTERNVQLPNSPSPWLGAFILTTLFGALDEGIQYFFPDRVFDLRDILFNTLAAFMALVAHFILLWGKEKFSARNSA